MFKDFIAQKESSTSVIMQTLTINQMIIIPQIQNIAMNEQRWLCYILGPGMR